MQISVYSITENCFCIYLCYYFVFIWIKVILHDSILPSCWVLEWAESELFILFVRLLFQSRWTSSWMWRMTSDLLGLFLLPSLLLGRCLAPLLLPPLLLHLPPALLGAAVQLLLGAALLIPQDVRHLCRQRREINTQMLECKHCFEALERFYMAGLTC